MSFLTTLPGEMESAATGLAGVGSTVVAANAAAAAPLNGVVPMAAEPASMLVAALFQTHGLLYQAMQGVGSAFHSMHVATLLTSAGTYAADEVANAVTML